MLENRRNTDALAGNRRIVLDDGDRGNDALEGAGAQRFRSEGISADRQETDFAGGIDRAAHELAADHQAAADTGADGDEGEIVDPLPLAQPVLAKHRQIDVVLDHHVEAERPGERSTTFI